MIDADKILKEIKEAFDENTDDIEDTEGVHHFAIDSFTAWYIARRIIRSHIDVRKKVSRARIITREIDGKPYYEIEYKEVGKDEYDIGYGSYCLDNVVRWLNECFEFCEKAEITVNDDWIPVGERLPEREGVYLCKNVYDEEFVCSYGWNFPKTKMKFFRNCVAYSVKEWKPLPESYKVKENK